LHVEAFREGEVPGIHSVIYESEIDSICITHEAKSRKGFALGAVLAAEFTKGKRGFLTMSDLLNLK
jgi:4-hydroxy-tetrahydrodipicolinate reductase